MPDYKQGKIYSLRSHQTDQVYIGSTIQPLYKRLFEHKKKYKKWMNGTHYYLSSYEIVKYDDVYVELVEEYPCDNKMQLLKREGGIIRNTEKCVNRYVAGRTNKEYCEDNKEHRAQYHKRWREANKDYISQKGKEYRENNKEYVSQKMKEYREANRENLCQQKREYYQENKYKMSQQKKINYHKRNPIGLATFGI